MKRILSVLLTLGMLLSLAPMAMAEEPVITEDEPVIEEPAPDGELDPLNAWIKDGKVYWDEVPGATDYWVYYYLADGSNGPYIDKQYDMHIPYSVMPVDLNAFFKERNTENQDIRVYVDAFKLRSSGYRETIAGSEKMTLHFDDGITYIMPDSRWDGTRIRWRTPDLTSLGISVSQAQAVIRLYEGGAELTSKRLPAAAESWDVGSFIEMPGRMYSYTLRFESGGAKASKTFESEEVLGQDLLSGFVSRCIEAASIDLTAPKAGAAIPSPAKGAPVPGSRFTIGKQYWCSSPSTSTRLTSGTFENGRTYYYYAELTPDESWEFAGDVGSVDPGELRVTACGANASRLDKNLSGRVSVFIPVKADGPVYTGNILLRGMPNPQPGAPVQSKTESVGERYEITAQGWYEDFLGLKPTADKTFKPGKTYVWCCTVELTDGSIFPEIYGGNLVISQKTVRSMTADEISEALKNNKPVRFWSTAKNLMIIRLSYNVEGVETKVTLSADGKSAQAENYDGLYARVALVLDNKGVSGLYVTQAAIGADGKIDIPTMMIPGIKVKGVNIALVPTIGDIQSAVPNVRATDFRML